MKQLTDDRIEKLFDLPEIPPRDERLKILLRERPDPKPEEPKSGKTFVLVSGLPRSGTSLMMQMLQAGGMNVMTDGKRVPDEDNPRGYYEWELLKQIGKKPELLDEELVNGRAIKCISILLPQMPAKHKYKLILMNRPIEEVVASQRAMTARLGTNGANLDDAQLIRGLKAHLDQIRNWLKTALHMEWIEISYAKLVCDPEPEIARLIEFVGHDRLPNSELMAQAIKPALYRKRAATSN